VSCFFNIQHKNRRNLAFLVSFLFIAFPTFSSCEDERNANQSCVQYTPLGKKVKYTQSISSETTDFFHKTVIKYYSSENPESVFNTPLLLENHDILRSLADSNKDPSYEACKLQAMYFRLAITALNYNEVMDFDTETKKIACNEKQKLKKRRKKDGSQYSDYEIRKILLKLKQNRFEERRKKFRGFLNMSPFSDQFVDQCITNNYIMETLAFQGASSEDKGDPPLSQDPNVGHLKTDTAPNKWLELIGQYGSMKQKQKIANYLLADVIEYEIEAHLWQISDPQCLQQSPELKDTEDSICSNPSPLIELEFERPILADSNPYQRHAAEFYTRAMEFKPSEKCDPDYMLMVLKGVEIYNKIGEHQKAVNAWKRVHQYMIQFLNSKLDHTGLLTNILPDYLEIGKMLLETENQCDEGQDKPVRSLLNALINHEKMRRKKSKPVFVKNAEIVMNETVNALLKSKE